MLNQFDPPGHPEQVWQRVTPVIDASAPPGVGARSRALVNSTAAEQYPRIIEAGVARDWACLAHDEANSKLHTGMEEAEEREVLAGIVGTIEEATGTRPRGWMGPGLAETAGTPELLAELGLDYVLDWTSDDQPFRHKYLDQALAHLAAAPDVWLTTSDDIAEHYLRRS